MQQNKKYPPTKRIGFLLVDGFTLMAFSNVIEPLRMANHVSKQDLYLWRVAGLKGDRTLSSGGITVAHTASLEHLLSCDLVFVCGGNQTEHLQSTALIMWIERLAVRNIALGGLCTGAMALAEAGLLEDKTASLHWENISEAQENFPGTQFHNEIFTISPQIYTSSGGVCALDMTLHIIQQHFGSEMVAEIQDMFIINTIREPTAIQHLPKPKIYSSGYKHVIDAIALMKSNIEEPLTITEIVNYLKISNRQLQRLFKTHFDKTPNQYYLQLRLEHAKYLLQKTPFTIKQISLSSGFLSDSSFSVAFKKQYQCSPSYYRKHPF